MYNALLEFPPILGISLFAGLAAVKNWEAAAGAAGGGAGCSN